MSDSKKRADPGDRRALLARLLAEQAERPLRAPASPGQKRLWYAMRAAPESPVYNCPLTIEVRGELDGDALASALPLLVERHEALRTTFEEVDGDLVQVVAPRGELKLERPPPTGGDLEDRRAAARAFARRFAREPFDLTKGPLYRVALVAVAPGEHLVLLNAHHIVSDGWSQGILLREWMAAYRARVTGRPLELSPLPLTYADVAAWQHEREPPAESLAYWRGALDGVEPLRLPLDFARPKLQTTAGARMPVRLSPEAAAHARAVSERHGASLFQVVLSAFQMLLALWCRQDRFVVGTPAHNRHRAEVEGIVGFFVSTVPVVADLSGDPTLREALDRLRRGALDALSQSEVSFERLVGLTPAENRGRGVPPLVQVLFVWQQGLLPETDLPGMHIHVDEEPTDTSKFDLTLSLRPDGDVLLGHVEYNSDLFGAASLKRLLALLEPMLEALHGRPDATLGDVLAGEVAPERPDPGLGPVLRSSTETARAYARTVARRKDGPAIWTDRRTLTFSELDAAASALAASMRAAGQRDGDPVALALPTGVEALVGIVAAWKCGSPYVPLDSGWPEARVRRILEETGARICLADDGDRRIDGAFRLGVDLEALLLPDAERERPGVLAARPGDLAYVMYTSGSTGEPKGVLVPHHALAHLDAALDATVYAAMAERPLRVGVLGSLAFDTTVKQIVRLLRGDCLCPIPPELKTSPARLAHYLGAASLDVVDVTPSWMRIVLDAGLGPGAPRTFLLGGEPIDAVLWHELALRQARGESRFVNLYGPTEATVDATWAEIRDDREPSIGRPLPDTRIWLLDERLRPVPPGFAGEIAIEGGGVARGYLDRPDASKAAFVDLTVDGRVTRVYRTGDHARHRDDDSLVFLGRLDRQVKRHGQRIELDEIEAALYSHPAVVAAAVTESAGRLVAWYQTGSERLAPEELAAHAARILPRGFLPDEYRSHPALPHNTSGKIDYTALASMRAADESAPASAPVHGGGDLRDDDDESMDAVIQIWTELLGSPPASGDADFFVSGGDSLLGLRLLARLEKRFRVALDVSHLASSPTPESLAAALSGASGGVDDRHVWLRRGSSLATPLALVHGTGGDVACYRPLVSLLDARTPVVGLPAPSAIPESLPELAEVHARSLLDVIERLPRREILVGGWSLGGVVALELARCLRRHGVAVPLVLLLDARLPSKQEDDASSRVQRAVAPRLGSELAAEELVHRFAARSEALLELWSRHVPEPYEGDVLLVRATSEPGGDPQIAAWRALAPRLGAVCRALDHDRMMRAPDVARVAQVVERGLNRFARESYPGA